MFQERRHRRRKTIRFELIPMIDVMMILVLFLAVMAFLPHQQGAIQTDLPGAGAAEKTVMADLFISLNASGALYVGDASVTQNSLVEEVKKQLQGRPDRRVVLAADKSLPYEEVIRILDTLRKADIRNVALAIEQEKPDHP